MVKEYVLRNVDYNDIQEIQKMVRESNSLIPTPSNINDVYDIERYRQESLFSDAEFKVILDNNIFTQIIPLIDGRKKYGEALTKEAKLICGIMCFLIYAGLETNPVSALYERPSDPNFISKEKQDCFFRIADHIHPQIFANLALEKYSDIPEEELEIATAEINRNLETKLNISKIKYPKDVDSTYLLMYKNLLKAWLLYKNKYSPEDNFKEYLKWHHLKSLSDQISVIFVTIFLSKKRFPKMIKKINSNDPYVILKNIKNSAWDIYHLSLLDKVYQDRTEEEIWFFCTRDKLLIDISKYLFKLSTPLSIKDFILEFYPENMLRVFENYIVQVNSRKNRELHSKFVLDNLQEEVIQLENDIFFLFEP